MGIPQHRDDHTGGVRGRWARLTTRIRRLRSIAIRAGRSNHQIRAPGRSSATGWKRAGAAQDPGCASPVSLRGPGSGGTRRRAHRRDDQRQRTRAGGAGRPIDGSISQTGRRRKRCEPSWRMPRSLRPGNGYTQPTVVNGVPVRVISTANVRFVLTPKPQAATPQSALRPSLLEGTSRRRPRRGTSHRCIQVARTRQACKAWL